MDRYTKLILTVIALALIGLNVQMLRPAPTAAGLFDGTVTWGEIMDLRNINDEKKRRETVLRIYRRIPLVRVQGGNTDAD